MEILSDVFFVNNIIIEKDTYVPIVKLAFVECGLLTGELHPAPPGVISHQQHRHPVSRAFLQTGVGDS